MVTASLKADQLDALRIEMIIRNLRMDALAAACGVTRPSLSSQFTANFPSRRMRLVVETVMGMPFWSSREEFGARQTLAQHCGFDPFTVPAAKVREYAARLKVRGMRYNRSKPKLIAMLQRHFAVQTKKTTQ